MKDESRAEGGLSPHPPTDIRRRLGPVLVCGGRDFSDRELLFRELDGLYAAMRFSEVIHGGAAGADTLAGLWAQERGVHARVYKAEWNKYGKGAGPIRNARMLETGKPDLVIAFAGGAGTADMVRRARKAGLLVTEIPAGPVEVS